MPKQYDFSTLNNLQEIYVSPKGWVQPLIVEYGIGNHAEVSSYFWRVKGTKHTFIIPVLRMDYLSQGNYAEHFSYILEEFREDYKEWGSQGFFAGWMQEYRTEFSKYICL